MIEYIVNDKQITNKEIETLLDKVESKHEEDLFYTSIRTSKKEVEAIKHSTFITARKISYIRHAGGLNSLNQLIGLIRIIGDSTYEYYITEVMVLPTCQGQGIGTILMKLALTYCKENGFMKIFLTAAPGREDFYKRFGFEKTKYTVMRILNKEIKNV